jgi:hypothetical protein
VIGILRASGAFGNRRAPGGTTNAFKMAAASATACSRGAGDAAVRDDVTGPLAGRVAAQPATATATHTAKRNAIPGAPRISGLIPFGRPAGHPGFAPR